MDNFTKTTEIDISDSMGMEDDTPKKSNVGKIIALVISLLVAICLWLYVTQTDTQHYDREYKNITVQVINETEYRLTVSDTVTVTVNGMKSSLADLKKADIAVFVDASTVDSEGEVTLDVKCVLPDGRPLTVTGLSTETVKAVSVKK